MAKIPPKKQPVPRNRAAEAAERRGTKLHAFELAPDSYAAIDTAAALLAQRSNFTSVPRVQALRILIARGLAALQADPE